MKFTERVMLIPEGSEFEITREQALDIVDVIVRLSPKNAEAACQLLVKGRCRFLGRILVIQRYKGIANIGP